MTDRFTLLALAGHFAGDFPLQTDRMAAEKFDSRPVRGIHVAVYTAAMIPAARASDWSRSQIGVFLATIATTHFVIDSRRWNDSVPIWYDQALHIISICLGTLLADGGRDD